MDMRIGEMDMRREEQKSRIGEMDMKNRVEEKKVNYRYK